MLRQILFVFLALFSTSVLIAQSGSIKGKVLDVETGDPVPFANIVVLRNGNQIGGTISDFDGNYSIKPVPAGKFTVKATFVGYKTLQINNVLVNADKVRFLDLKLSSTSVKIDEIVVQDFKVPLISKDETQTGGTVTSEDIEKMSGRSAESVAATVGGVYQEDGQVKSVRGSREGATTYYIDGIKVRGSKSVPKSSIQEVTVVTGGLAAKYGDATGGIISITTKGPSRNFFGSAELVTSADGYSDNLAALSLSGPIWSKKITNPDDPTKFTKKTIAGFFVAAEATYTLDNHPFPGGSWTAKDNVINEIKQNPIVPTANTGAAVLSAEYLHANSFEKIHTRKNVASMGANISGKIDIAPFDGGNITIGGTFSYSKNDAYIRSYSYFNSDKNPEIHNYTWRSYLKWTHRFKNKEAKKGESGSLIKNIFYTAQVDVSQSKGGLQDGIFKDNLFNYGYYGKFNIRALPTYIYGQDTATGLTGYIQNGFIETLDTVISTSLNPAAGRYNELYYENYDPQYNITYLPTIVDLQNGGGLLNGQSFTTVGLANLGSLAVPGATYNDYYNYDNMQAHFTINGSADVGDHEISMGFEIEQRFDRFYDVSPIGLWSTGRLLMNSHISELDFANPIVGYVKDADGNNLIDPVTGQPVFNDTVSYNRLVSTDNQYLFDLRFRQAHGIDEGTWINMDGYDPEDFDIKYFSADELFNNGNTLTSYYGYDHTGKQVGTDVTFNDFFTETYIDEVGNKRFVRNVPVNMPIYAAGYVQDKFSFNDLVFNVGVRLDYYDLNQKVLKDKYSFYETYKVGDDLPNPELANNTPSNIPVGSVIYVDDITNAKSVLGYRNGDVWYNAAGQMVNSSKSVESGKGIQPYLLGTKPKAGDQHFLNAFTDYTPQWIPMPRISFSFPISDEALFFAHYDVLTQRPNASNSRISYIDYLFINSRGGSVLNNPDMKPQRTTDYELGFQQKLSNTSSLKISAFYKEMRDMSQVRYIYGAYPVDYITYDNIDFGTVKGLTTTFDLRRTGNVRLTASYTLQFAKGTGSDATTALSLIRAGQPNLRTINPLSFDKTHSFNVILDYRYKSGKDYNGPKLFGADILANAGMNLVLSTGSGTPFSYRDLADNTLIGNINGSTMPWRTTLNMRIDKDFYINVGGGKDDNQKQVIVNVYADIANLLDARNILGVYSTTGNPDDNGWLTYAGNQSTINAQHDKEAFINYYRMYVDNPYNYTMPRRIKLGVQVSF